MKPTPWTLPLMLALFALSTVQAQPKPDARNERPPQGQQGEGGHRRPPPEALEACKTLKANAACSFQHPERGTVKGQCGAPEGKPLACRPAGGPPPDDKPQGR